MKISKGSVTCKFSVMESFRLPTEEKKEQNDPLSLNNASISEPLKSYLIEVNGLKQRS